jgi:hypothetical protein
MALNPNHAFEDLGEVKCAIVEKNCTPERTAFLKDLLEFNGFEVVIVNSPPPKAAAKPAAPVAENAEGATEPTPAPAPASPPPPTTFTVGVTDLSFSPINAVYNRELRAPGGMIVTTDYWKQREEVTGNRKWYWQK